MIFEGYDEDNIPLFNYSNGGNKPTDYKKARRYSDNDLKDAKAFRFIGNDQDIKNWTKEYNERYKNGGIISTPVRREDIRPSLANGGGIYIKPSHRGRLTELKARTGKTESELYNDGNPAHKKMVVFARNARKWNH